MVAGRTLGKAAWQPAGRNCGRDSAAAPGK
jgi:hypothetical protein